MTVYSGLLQAGDYIGSTDLIDEDDKDWYSFRTKELNK
jgi:hypothetical protein